jgi:hypothetical protein
MCGGRHLIGATTFAFAFAFAFACRVFLVGQAGPAAMPTRMGSGAARVRHAGVCKRPIGPWAGCIGLSFFFSRIHLSIS